jgi:hypothetical protein
LPFNLTGCAGFNPAVVMEVFSFLGWFVQHPLRILALAALLAAMWAALRRGRVGRRADALCWPVLFCLLFAAWEWVLLLRTPEANIRVDLLLIWPALAGLIAWSLWRVFRR